MREIRPYGSVRGARRKARPYRDREGRWRCAQGTSTSAAVRRAKRQQNLLSVKLCVHSVELCVPLAFLLSFASAPAYQG
jgi:hypothetical protein